MSRKGKQPILIPKGVEVKIGDNELTVKGPKGNLKRSIIPQVQVKVEGEKLIVEKAPKFQNRDDFHGLYRTLIYNMVVGVSTGYEKKLEMIGVGYRAAVQGQQLDLSIGLSHPTKLDIPEGIQVKVEKNTTIIITGSDKQVIGQFAANIRSRKPPEPYQGKGIRYVGEYVRKKAGKAAGAAKK